MDRREPVAPQLGERRTGVPGDDVPDQRSGVIQTIRSVLNPDKPRHLGPVADVEGMLRAIREERGTNN